VRRGGRSQQFPALPDYQANASFGLPFTAAGITYYSTLISPAYRDVSFAIIDETGPLAIIQCDIDNGGPIGRFGMPIEIWQRGEPAPAQDRQFVREMMGELQRLALDLKSPILIRTSSGLDPGGFLAARLADMGGEPIASVRAVLDLSRSDEELLKAMHKGHRQDIRWGADHLTMRLVDKANPDEALFDAYRLLHADVSGRVTRPMESWQAMFGLIAGGEGDLLLAYLDRELVGGTLVLDGGDRAYYASGANRRERFDKGISHYPLFLACIRARSRGRRLFDVGETRGGSIDRNDLKQIAIGRFKSGFTDSADTSFIWTVPAKTP